MTIAIKERTFFKIVGWAAIGLSLGGVAYAILLARNPADAGRGGALADAIALATLFGTRNYAADTYEALTVRAPARKLFILNLLTPADSAAVTETNDKLARVIIYLTQ